MKHFYGTMFKFRDNQVRIVQVFFYFSDTSDSTTPVYILPAEKSLDSANLPANPEDSGSSIMLLCLASVPFRFYVILAAFILYSVLATYTIINLKKENRKLGKKQKVRKSKKSKEVTFDMHTIDIEEIPPPQIPARTDSLLNIDELPLPLPPASSELK
jgi:hypothetical protein